jgi:hypothetical protein
MWENIQILLNGANVLFVTTTNMHIKAYLETILTFGHDAARTHLTAAGFCMDIAGKFDDPMSAANQERRSWTALSAEVGFSSNIHVDVLSVPRYRGEERADKQFRLYIMPIFFRLLLNNMPIQITFSKTPDNFLILNGQDTTATNNTVTKDTNVYRVVLTELELRVKKIQIGQELSVNLDRKLSGSARTRYPLTRTELKSYTIASGSSSFIWSNALLGRMPFTLVAGLTTQDSFTVSPGKNGFNFGNHNCKEFWYTVNNVDYPTRHYRPEWSDLTYRKEYRMTVDGLQGLGNNGSQLQL